MLRFRPWISSLDGRGAEHLGDLSEVLRSGEPAELSDPVEREIMAVRTVRLSPAVYERLLGLATSRGIGTSVLMRQIIEQWVESQSGTGTARNVVAVDELVAFLNRVARPAAA